MKNILLQLHLFLTPIFVFISLSSSAQYYYKDIIGTRETAELINTYRNNKVGRVLLTSYDESNTRISDFFVEQEFSIAQQTLKTTTRSDITNASTLTAYFDADGRVIKTVDSSSTVISTSLYSYNSQGQLISIVSASVDSFKTANETEQHIWLYNNNKIRSMLRIKNKRDTIYVNFKFDENGNISEEQEIRKGVKGEPVYYFYNDTNHLTDIVRYNKKAKRLLPEYMFEYSSSNQVIQKITVPANGDAYLIWRYQYNAQGLKTKEVIYNKQKQLTGKIEYQYSFIN